jgi:hypothetical protein
MLRMGFCFLIMWLLSGCCGVQYQMNQHVNIIENHPYTQPQFEISLEFQQQF